MINVEFFSKSRHSLEEVRGFIKSNLSNSILADNKFFSWSFGLLKDSDVSQGDILIASINNNIVGILGLNKRDFLIKGRKYRGAETTNLYIKSPIPGIASIMFKTLHSKFDVILGASPSTKMILPLLNMGYCVQDLPRYIFIPEKNKNIEAMGKGFNRANFFKRLKLKQEFSEESWINFIGVMKDDLNQPNIGFSRDQEYLKWRYQNHPYYKYIPFVDHGNHCLSYFILREEFIKDSLILRVVDLRCSPENASGLYESLESIALRKKALFLDFFSSILNFKNIILRDNWIGADLGNNLTLPYLLKPIEYRDGNCPKYQIYLKNLDLVNFDLASLQITKSDADLDRPTLYDLSEDKFYQ
jgi:hypothetical protein